MGGCEQRIEVFVKMQNKSQDGRGGGWSGGSWLGVVGDGGCKPRIESIVKWGVQV